MSVATQPITLAEFLRQFEHQPGVEFIDGRVAAKMSPKARHAHLAGWLLLDISNFVARKKLAKAFVELRGLYGENSFIPDIAVYRWSRLVFAPDGRLADCQPDTPDIAIEILSPRQNVARQLSRCQLMVDRGVEIVLHVNPNDETVTYFRVGETATTLTGDAVIDLSSVMPGYQLTPRRLFGSLWDPG